MIFLTTDEIIALHEKLLNKTGGLDGIRDLNLLESAVSNCLQTFDGQELYPAITDKAAYLAYAPCRQDEMRSTCNLFYCSIHIGK